VTFAVLRRSADNLIRRGIVARHSEPGRKFAYVYEINEGEGISWQVGDEEIVVPDISWETLNDLLDPERPVEGREEKTKTALGGGAEQSPFGGDDDPIIIFSEDPDKVSLGKESIPERALTSGNDEHRDRARAQLQAVLGLLRTLHAGLEVALFVEQRRPRVTVSARLGEFGWEALTVGMLNTIFIAPDVLEKTLVQAALLYAHEFGHLLFGKDRPVECTIDSIEQEYVAESLAARVWAELNPNAPPDEYEKQVGWILDQPAEAAYQAIRQWGPYYATLPEKQPRWYQAWQYWPAVEYILRVALGVRGLETLGDRSDND
jgi:hypothetical protein